MTRIRLFLIGLVVSLQGFSQSKDAGLWADISIGKELTERFEISFSPEIRMDENISRWARCFADFGAEYKINKRFSTALVYRGGWSNDGVFVDYRQRMQYGWTWKQKWEDLVVQLQTRAQVSLAGSIGDADADFVTLWRNRFGVKYTGLKKIDLATSIEAFNSASRYNRLELQNWRWLATATREITKKQSIALGYLIQRDLTESPQEMDYVFLLSYKVDL